MAMAMPDNVNRYYGFLNPSWTGAWPDSAVDVAYPAYTAAWPGADVKVDHGKKKRSAFTVEGNTNQVSYDPPRKKRSPGMPFAYTYTLNGWGDVASVTHTDSDAAPSEIVASWPGANVKVTHKKKRSAPVVDPRKKRSPGMPFAYTYTLNGWGPAASVTHTDSDAAPSEIIASWPGANVKVVHKRSAEPCGYWCYAHPLNNVNQVSGPLGGSYPIYNSAWPGARVSVNHG